MQDTKTYFLYYLQDGEPCPFYVGESVDPDVRLRQHQRDAADQDTSKEAYRFLIDNNIREFFMEVVEGQSEAELVKELTLAGYRLFNANGGIRATAKKRKELSTFAKLNREADARLALKEAAAERRNFLHSRAQNLSKSEIVQQRITGNLPSADALAASNWRDVPVEMLGSKVRAKKIDRAEACKWGDYDIVVGFRNQDRHTVCVARHRTDEEVWANGAGFTHCEKRRILELLTERWARTF